MTWLASLLGSFRAAGLFASGRRAFLVGNYREALEHFEKLVATKPNYIFTSGNFRQGVWSYIGRCHYFLGAFAEARHGLERAIVADDHDHLARLFIGLTFARRGDYSDAARELARGIEGLGQWIENENSRDTLELPWDPTNGIRRQIIASLAMISGKQPDWPKLIESAEWIGAKM
jgi:tetratricopeptide (TPR) repeat protein